MLIAKVKQDILLIVFYAVLSELSMEWWLMLIKSWLIHAIIKKIALILTFDL